MKNFFLLLLLLPAIVSGQFAPERILMTNHIINPSLVRSVDLNNDGMKDIISYSSEYKQLTIVEQKTDLDSWKPSVLMSRDSSISYITYGDIDGDDDIDIIYSTGSRGKVKVLRNIDKTGEFTASEVLASGMGNVLHMDLADYDGDGDLDFATASDTKDDILWFENLDGEGNFGSANVIASDIENAREVRSFDVDGDEDLDLVVSGRAVVKWYANTNGLGEYSEGVEFKNMGDWSSVFPVDFDNDGDIDLVSGSFGDDQVGWSENIDGKGIFSDRVLLFKYKDLYHLHVCDLDQDNDVDILIASYINQNELSIFENLGGNSFSEEQQLVDASIFAFDVDDMDGDNDLDIIVPDRDNDEIKVFENVLFDQDTLYEHSVEWGISDPTMMIPIDFDQDGHQDFLSTSTKLIWHRNTGKDNLTFENIVLRQGKFEGLRVEDVDSDGDLDIIYALKNYNQESVRCLINDDFQFTMNYIVEGKDFASGDINGDGNIDIVSSYIGIRWHDNYDGLGNFDSTILVKPDGVLLSVIELEDIDHDGDLDIIASRNEGSPSVFWFENTDGKGNFGEPIELLSSLESSYVTGFAFGDIDGDADNDIVVADWAKGEISILKNISGGAEYSSPITLNIELPDSYTVILADLDNDGDLDIVATQPAKGWVIMLENDGEGGFAEYEIIADQDAGANCLAVSDFDSDGDKDLLVGFDGESYFVSKFSLFENMLVDLFVDLDNDGYDVTEDCDDEDPCINPSALEIEDNGIDENCDGFDFQPDPEEESVSAITLFPNPSNGILNIELLQGEYEAVSIFNSDGLKVLEQNYSENLEVDISEYQSGIYYVQVKSKNGVAAASFVKL